RSEALRQGGVARGQELVVARCRQAWPVASRRVAARRAAPAWGVRGSPTARRGEGGCPSVTGDGRAQGAQILPVGAPVPIVFIDCSAIMRRALDHLGHLGNLGHLSGLGHALVVHEGDPTPAELATLLSEARVVLNGHTILDERVLSGATHLRSIVFLGTGASTYIDMSSAARRGIRVRRVRHYVQTGRLPSMHSRCSCRLHATLPAWTGTFGQAAGRRAKASSSLGAPWGWWAWVASARRWRASPPRWAC